MQTGLHKQRQKTIKLIYIIIYIYPHTDKMYVSVRQMAINCIEVRSFTVRGMRVLKCFAKDMYLHIQKLLHSFLPSKTTGKPKEYEGTLI